MSFLPYGSVGATYRRRPAGPSGAHGLEARGTRRRDADATRREFSVLFVFLVREMFVMVGYLLRSPVDRETDWHTLNPWYLEALLKKVMWITLERTIPWSGTPVAGDDILLGHVPGSLTYDLPSVLLRDDSVVYTVPEEPYMTGEGWVWYQVDLDCHGLGQLCDAAAFLVRHCGFEICEVPEIGEAFT